jgi:hypothetical protein
VLDKPLRRLAFKCTKFEPSPLKMSLLVAVKTSGTRQTTKQLTRADAMPGTQLRGWCVHAVGGESGTATLTANRRESIRKAHNKKVRHGSSRCCLHVGSWKAKLARQYGILPAQPVATTAQPTPVATTAQATPVATTAQPTPVVTTAQPTPVATQTTLREQLTSFMSLVDENREQMNDGAYLAIANTLHAAHRRLR